MAKSTSTEQLIEAFDQSGNSPPRRARRPSMRRGSPIAPRDHNPQTRRTGERLLRISEVQERLGIGRTKVYEMVAAETLPCVKLGPRSKRVPESALDEWIQRNTQGAQDTVH